MESSSADFFAGCVAPLVARFGDRLTLARRENVVCWRYDGQSAVVELHPNGRLTATFIGADGLDAVAARPAAAVYSTNVTYALDPASCRRMVADLYDFFSGVREPKFTFVDAYLR